MKYTVEKYSKIVGLLNALIELRVIRTHDITIYRDNDPQRTAMYVEVYL